MAIDIILANLSEQCSNIIETKTVGITIINLDE